MNPDLFGIIIAVVSVVLYIVIAVGAYKLLDEKFDWPDDGCMMGSMFWPITLVFWLLIGFPVMAVLWAMKRLKRLRKRASFKTSEVK